MPANQDWSLVVTWICCLVLPFDRPKVGGPSSTEPL